MNVFILKVTCTNRESDECVSEWEEITYFATLPKAQDAAYARAREIDGDPNMWDTHTDLNYLSMSLFDGTCYDYWITIESVDVIE